MTPPFDRAAAKRAGYTDAEIDAFLASQGQQADPYKPTTTPRIGSESTGTRATIRNATPEQVAANRQADVSLAKGVGRGIAQGATFGFADEIEAGARSLGGRPYREIRDEIRGEDAAFARENPALAFGANVVGGIATGGGLAAAARKAPALAAVGLAPKASATATTAQRVGQAAKVGGAAGVLGGAGIAPEIEDVPLSATVGGTIGATTGGLFAGMAEALRGTRNLAARVGQGDSEAGAVRRAIRADSPEESGVRRVLQLAGKQGMSVDDVAARSAAADGPDVLGEVLGQRGVRAIRTARGLGYQAPDAIENTLTTRARNDVNALRQTVRSELGEQMDDVALREAKRKEAQDAAGPLYQQALDGVEITDPRMVQWMQRPAIRSAYQRARSMAANDGQSLPPVAAMVRNAAGRVEDTADDVIGATTRRAGRADAAGDDLVNLDAQGLRGMRRGGDIGTMTEADLDAERMYLAQMQGDDAARAAVVESPDYAEYVSLREIGAREDARGIMERMGFADPNDFAAATRDGQAAAGRMADRAQRIKALEDELARRGQVGPARAVPGRGAVSVPEAEQAATLPTLTGRQVQYVKLSLDDEIAKLEGMRGGTSTNRYRQLIEARDDVENLLYEFANQGEDGASLWGQAQKAYATPMQQADAFAEGVRGGRGIQPPDAPRLLAGPQSDWRARGVANTLQDDLARLGDGAVGNIRDPGPTLMGSDAARARLEVAAGGDMGKVGRIENAASNVSRRLRNRQTVIGNSQTAEKLADMAEQGVNPSELLQAAQSPTGAAVRWLGQQGNALRRNVIGQDMDAMSRLLLAGGPNQMSREEALAMIRRMEPLLVEQMLRQMVTRGAVGGATARAVPAR